MKNAIRLLVLAVAVAGVVGCNPTVRPTEGGEKITPPTTQTGDGETMSTDPWASNDPKKVLADVPCLQQRVITFDLDRADVKGEYQETIACHAKFLKKFPEAKLGLEGHTDERGTREYNLGLGERRGNSVGDMLKAEGASGGQISTVSYGEERPTCTESDESCWGQNRRAELVYSGI